MAILAIALVLTGCGNNSITQISDTGESFSSGTISASGLSRKSFSAPPENIRFSRIGVSNGLSQGVVTCLLQDAQGFIWVGTQDGLNRYDGYNFKVFRPSPGKDGVINDHWINTLYQDTRGLIWIGTRLGGLNQYDPSTGLFTNFINDPNDPTSLVSNTVTAVFEDSKGRIWVGTAEGLERYSPATHKFEHISFNPLPSSEPSADEITVITEDGNNRLLIGTANSGIYLFDEKSTIIKNFRFDPAISTSISSNQIRTIHPASNASIWVGTEKGLNHLVTQTGYANHFFHDAANSNSIASDSVQAFFVDSQENIWIGTNNGLDLYDVQTGNFFHYINIPSQDATLSQNSISAILESIDGVIWVGTMGGGMNKYYRGQDAFMLYQLSTNNQTAPGVYPVTSLATGPDGSVWIGSLGGGLYQLSPLDNMLNKVALAQGVGSKLGDELVHAVFTDHQGTLWVGTENGLEMLAVEANDFVHFQHNPGDQASLIESPVLAIAETQGEQLWFGTDSGLEKFDALSNTFKLIQYERGNPSSLSGNEIRSSFVDRSGKLWVGTFNDGLNAYDSSTGQFIRHMHNPDDPSSISSNSIISIFQAKDGVLWIGTDGGGLNRYNPATGRFMQFGEADGFSNNVIYAILEDRVGNLWISTNHGITCFDPRTGKGLRNYTEEDGIQGNQFSPNAAMMDPEGRMYFGGMNGLTVFDPAMIQDSPFIPPVMITSLTEDGVPYQSSQTVETLNEITVRWPKQGFEFEYAALSYAQPSKNKYAYLLENFDRDWNQVGNRKNGRYTNLPGGKYVLRIIGSNQDDIWNEDGVSIKVNVIPPFWQALWFQVFVIGTLVAIGLTAYWMRLRSVQTYNLVLERQVRERTQEIEKLFEKTKELAVVEERNRLARELHDSAKQKAFAALAQLGAANGTVKKDYQSARRHLDEAENLVLQVIEDLTFLIQEMYPKGLKEKGLPTTLREYVYDWENRTDIRASVRIDNERRLNLNIEQGIFRVTQEALSNVSRHSRADKVEIRLSYHPESVVAEIEDNGCGFDYMKKQEGTGLHLIRERIERLGGTVEIESKQECGTRLTVRLPITI